jgi:hypothetical protein
VNLAKQTVSFRTRANLLRDVQTPWTRHNKFVKKEDEATVKKVSDVHRLRGNYPFKDLQHKMK